MQSLIDDVDIDEETPAALCAVERQDLEVPTCTGP